jgi:hypothetical protein
LCFATSSQPEPIWIACIAVMAFGVVHSSYVMYMNRPIKSESIPLSLPLPGSNVSCLSDDETSVKLQLSCQSLYKLVQTCTSQKSWQAASSTS